MSETISREAILTHLKDYRKYLHKVKNDIDPVDSGYLMVQGAIKAVNNLLTEVRKGKV
jgi:hypothetical protein